MKIKYLRGINYRIYVKTVLLIDYILYGEIEIYRVDADLNVIWQFSAKDIFVRYQGKETAFIMKTDRICLFDFLDN